MPHPHYYKALIRESLLQPTSVFGIAMIALLWAGVIVLLDVERQSNRFTVEKDTAILARMFEQNIIR
ncbi:MAG: hypothetical protein AB7O43_21320, partial [Hyphomicrobiaceae bacterium]